MTAVAQEAPVSTYEPPRAPLPRAEKRVAPLDGIRGIAVLLVMFGHAGWTSFNGALGVDIFFVLSGYLITAILLNEMKKTGKLNFFNFYMRRVLRLFPALLLLVILYLIGCRILGKSMGRAFGDAGIALVYASNWTRAFGNRPTFLGHTWSLSIEEQFYLLWPVTVLGLFFLATRVKAAAIPAVVSVMRPLARSPHAFPRRTARLGFKLPGILATVVGLAACAIGITIIILHRASIAQRVDGVLDQFIVQRNFFRIYFGLDTRGDSLLFGAAMAFWTPKLPRFAAAVVGWIGIMGMAWYVLRLQTYYTAIFPDGSCMIYLWDRLYRFPAFLMNNGAYPFGPIAAWTTVMLVGLVNYRDGLLAWLLSFKPLVWVGVVSYGLYLYHFPIVIQMGPTEWKWSVWEVTVWGLSLSFLIATLSYYLVERPCLRLKDRFRTRTPALVPATKEGIMPQETKSMPQNPDDLEHAPGFAHEKLEGSIPAMASEQDVRDALEKAFDYRGDVTITRKDGTTVEGYIFDRRPGMTLVDSAVRLFPKDQDEKISITYDQIAALAFSGKDTAAGKTWETWLKKYREKKAAGEKNIGLEPEKLD